MPRAYSSVICSAAGFANATFSYLEKASHRIIFIKKVNAVAVTTAFELTTVFIFDIINSVK